MEEDAVSASARSRRSRDPGLRGEPVGDARQVEGASEPVQEAETEEQEGGGHGAEQEVLDGRLRGFGPRLVKAGEKAEGDARQFKGDEPEEQRGGRRHQGEAGGGEQEQGDVLRDVRQAQGPGCGGQHEEGEAEDARAGDPGEGIQQHSPGRQGAGGRGG